MARKDDKPQTHVVMPSPKGATCATCHEAIAVGQVRLFEAYASGDGNWARSLRYARNRKPRSEELDSDGPAPEKFWADLDARQHHLACAAEHLPYRLLSPLAAYAGPLPERDDLNEAIRRAMQREGEVVDKAAADPDTRDKYADFLARAAEDDEALIVLGDWLQTVGDPRGQLIAVQHSLETAKGAEELRLREVEKRVLSTHRELVPDASPHAFVWRRGFVQRANLDATASAKLERILSHPSAKLVREVAIAAVPPRLPASTRVLEVSAAFSRDELAALLAAAPTLERLRLRFTDDLRALHHKTLVELELFDETPPRAEYFVGPERKHVPALRRLVLRFERGLEPALALVAGTPLVRKLDALVLHGPATPGGLEPLRALKGKLGVLDLRGTTIRHTEAELVRDLATTVEITPPPAIKEWLVRHTRKPEWGIGRVVEESEAGREVEFETGGRKLVKNVELLEDVEAPE